MGVVALAGAIASWAGRAHAQTRVGIVGGINATTLHQGEVRPTPGIHCDGFDYDPTTHFSAGGVVEVGWRSRWGLRLAPSYSVEGASYPDPTCYFPQPPGSVPAPAAPNQNDLRLSYVELPTLLTFAISHRRGQPYVLGGPVVGYLLGANVRRNGQERDVQPLLNRWTAGIALGGGLRFVSGKGAVFVEGRGDLGLVNLGASGAYRPVSPQYSASRGRGLQLLVGFTSR